MSSLNTYYYRVLLPHGAVKSGLIRLAVKRDLSVRMRLEKDTDGTVIHLWRFPDWLGMFSGLLMRLLRVQVRSEDLAGFLRDLGLMMRAGVPAMDALSTLVEESEHSGASRAMGSVARNMLEDLKAGVGMTGQSTTSHSLNSITHWCCSLVRTVFAASHSRKIAGRSDGSIGPKCW